MTDSIDAQIREALNQQNLQRLRPVTLAVAPIVAAHVVYFWLSAKPEMGVEQLRWRALQFDSMTGILLGLLVLSALSWAAWRKAPAALGWRGRLPTAFATLFVCGSALVAVIDQLVVGAITPFITASLGVALVLRLRWRSSVLVFAAGLTVVEAGLLWMNVPTDARTSEMLNSLTVTGVALAISVTLTGALVETERARRTIERQSEEIARLRGFLRVCAWCKRVTNEEEQWEQLDRYVARSAGVRITHGICPDCSIKTFGEAGVEPR